MAKAISTINQKQSIRGGKRQGAGRRKGTVNKATYDVRLAARSYAPEALAELSRLSTKAVSEGARVAAIKELLDRAYGKSPQPLTGEGGEGGITVVLRRFAGDYA